MREAACRNRSGAGLPFGTSVAENKNLKNLARPVVSRLARIRSGGEDDATHFGPRSQVSAWVLGIEIKAKNDLLLPNCYPFVLLRLASAARRTASTRLAASSCIPGIT